MIGSDKLKYKKLLRTFKGGLFQKVLKIIREKGIQWVLADTPTYNSVTGFWESEDKSDNGNNIKWTNSSIGKFDGIDDYGTFNDISFANGSEYSLCVEIKPSSFVNFPHIISDSSSSFRYIRFDTDGILRLEHGGTTQAVSSYVFSVDTKYNIVFNFNLDYSIDLYINGEFEETMTGWDANSNEWSIIGGFGDLRQFDGDFYKLLVFKRLLTQQEITNCYNSECISDPELHLDFTECNGDIVYDKSDNANHVTLFNTDDAFWDVGNVKPINIIYGFDKWTLDSDSTKIRRVPFDNNGDSIKTDGDTITGYTWVSRNIGCTTCKGHNGAESENEQYYDAKINQIDDEFTTPVFYSGVTPQSYDRSEYKANKEALDIWMTDVDNELCYKNSILFDPDNPLTDEEKIIIELYLNHIEKAIDEDNGSTVIDEDDNSIVYDFKDTYTT
jgi:hypothetical protein